MILFIKKDSKAILAVRRKAIVLSEQVIRDEVFLTDFKEIVSLLNNRYGSLQTGWRSD